MNKWLDNICAGLFYLGLAAEILLVIWDKSSWTDPYMGQICRMTFLLFAVCCACSVRKSTMAEDIVFAIGVLIGALSWRFGGRNDLLRIVIFLRAAGTVSVPRAMKVTFVSSVLGCLGLVGLAFAGIQGHLYQTYDYGHGVETRWDLGLGHPNSLHCMAAMLLIFGLYLFEKRMKLYLYVLLGVGNVLLYGLTRSNTAFAISMLALMLSLLLHYGKKLAAGNAVYFLGELFLFGGLLFSVFCGIYRPSGHWLLEKLDHVLTGRISSLWTTTFHEGTLSTWKWFGQRLNVCYFDLGWLRVVYWYGVIPALVIIGLTFALLEHARKTRDKAAFMLLLCFGLYTVFEAHLVSAYIGRNYALFIAALY
ncbi:MAG: hypothetical protein Q3982_08480, partial [Phoenicibacter congonensis]|nr:hypothetical protein [Phoenicibacter congonensis]